MWNWINSINSIQEDYSRLTIIVCTFYNLIPKFKCLNIFLFYLIHKFIRYSNRYVKIR